MAKNLGVAASDIHLRTDASETTVKRTPCRFAAVLRGGGSRGLPGAGTQHMR
jgi:hypothetical protein